MKNKNAWNWVIFIAIVLIIVVIGYLILRVPNNTNGNLYSNNNSNGNPAANEGTTTGTNPQTFDIAIQNFAFSPSTITINQGDTITWTNMDSSTHTVTSDSGSELASGNIPDGQTFSHTFNTVGTFDYHCSIHPMMKGEVIVQ
jgi:plastocyanin